MGWAATRLLPVKVSERYPIGSGGAVRREELP